MVEINKETQRRLLEGDTTVLRDRFVCHEQPVSETTTYDDDEGRTVTTPKTGTEVTCRADVARDGEDPFWPSESITYQRRDAQALIGSTENWWNSTVLRWSGNVEIDGAKRRVTVIEDGSYGGFGGTNINGKLDVGDTIEVEPTEEAPGMQITIGDDGKTLWCDSKTTGLRDDLHSILKVVEARYQGALTLVGFIDSPEADMGEILRFVPFWQWLTQPTPPK